MTASLLFVDGAYGNRLIRALRNFTLPKQTSMPGAPTVLSVVGVTAVVAVVGYAVWFDQKRRNDPGFRRQLSKSLSRLASCLSACFEEEQLIE
jgi:hypothetical protein